MNSKLNSLDLLMVLKLAARQLPADLERAEDTVRYLAASLAVPKSAIGRSLVRLRQQSLVIEEATGRRLNRILVRDLFAHGVRWLAPATPGKMAIGLLTAHAASPLAERLPGDVDPVVIPFEDGPAMGRSVSPLHASAGAAAQRDQRLYELLTIVDGIRIGSAREREVAIAELEARL